MRFRTSVAAASAASALLAASVGAARPARADLKVGAELTMSGMPGTFGTSGMAPKTQTTYYKGDKLRQETATEVSIFDCGAGQIYFLNPAKKTYWTQSLQAMVDSMAKNPMMARMKFDTTADVTPTNKIETIAGLKAKEYLFTIVMKMTMPGRDSSMLPKLKMSGEQWFAVSQTTPTNCKQMAQFSQRAQGMFGPALKTLADKMADVKGLPLRNKITMTFAMSGPMAAQMNNSTMVTTREVKSLSEETLPDSLFVVPSDYTKVNAPSMMGPGGRGGMATRPQ